MGNYLNADIFKKILQSKSSAIHGLTTYSTFVIIVIILFAGPTNPVAKDTLRNHGVTTKLFGTSVALGSY